MYSNKNSTFLPNLIHPHEIAKTPKFIEIELGTSKAEEIVGKIDIERVSELIKEIDDF